MHKRKFSFSKCECQSFCWAKWEGRGGIDKINVELVEDSLEEVILTKYKGQKGFKT